MTEAPDPIDRVFGSDRRTFLKRLIGAAFVAPVISSYKMSGIGAVFGGISGATTAMSNSNTAGPNFPFNRGCFQFAPNGGTRTVGFTGGDGTTGTLNVPNNAFPNLRTVCVYRGDLAAFKNSLPPGNEAEGAYAVVFESGDAALQLTLTIVDSNVSTGDVIFRVDQGTQSYPGTVGAGTWSVSFTEDPSFVVATPPAAPPTPGTTPGAPGAPTDAPGVPAPSGGEAGTSAGAATPTEADPRFTG